MYYEKFQKFNTDKVILSVKISIIILIGIYVFGEALPYFLASDAYTYGNSTKFLVNGNLAITNELLMKTGNEQFVPTAWIKTIDNYAVPQSYGLSYFAALGYMIFGEYGIFYFNPIITILFLIIAERVSTKLFNKHVGLLTLLLLSTNHLILKTGINFQTENTAGLFFILGVFFLIKFFKDNKDRFILFSSIFFVFSVFVRTAGILVFPLELVLLPIVFIFSHKIINSDKNKDFKKNIFKISNSKKIFYFIIPWILFLIFWFSFNDSFFGDPLTNYRMQNQDFNERLHRDSNFSSFFNIELKHFEIFKDFSRYLLPYQINAVYQNLDNKFENILGNSWISLFTFLIFAFSILIALKKKKNRIDIFILILLTIPILWFYASVTTEERAELGVPGRYVIPSTAISYIILSYVIFNIFSLDIKFIKKIRPIIFLILLTFFALALYNSPPIQDILNNEFEFRNLTIYANGYPIDKNGLNEYSVIAARNTNWVIDHGYIPFSLPMKELLTNEDIKVLKDTMNDGYDVFTYKAATYPLESDVMRELVNNHKFVLKNFSDSFCKMEINNKFEKSDEICFSGKHKPEFLPRTIENYGY